MDRGRGDRGRGGFRGGRSQGGRGSYGGGSRGGYATGYGPRGRGAAGARARRGGSRGGFVGNHVLRRRRRRGVGRRARQVASDELTEQFGFERFELEAHESSADGAAKARGGSALNMLPATLRGPDGRDVAAVELFLLAEDGGSFKVDVLHRPYFYAAPARRWAKHARELAGVVRAPPRRDGGRGRGRREGGPRHAEPRRGPPARVPR